MEFSDGREMYIIRARNPLDMEGSPDVTAVFFDKNVADDTAERLNKGEEEANRKVWNDRWRSFAVEYTVEAHPVLASVDEAMDYLKDDE